MKLLFFFSKKEGATDEQFHRHWETVHADLTIASKDFRVFNIQRYTQIHQTADMKEKVKSTGADLLDYDGCSELWVKSWDDWAKFAKVGSRLYPDHVADSCKRVQNMRTL